MKKILLCLFLIHTDTAYSANCELDTQDSALCEAANGGDAGACFGGFQSACDSLAKLNKKNQH